MKSVALHNLGCKVNAYEMEVMQQKLVQNGYQIVPFAPGADIYLINTCTVTGIADRKSRQMLHRAKKMNPDAVVVAVGCYVQTGEKELIQDESVDLIIGNNRKKDIVEIIGSFLKDREADKTLNQTTVLDIHHTYEYEQMQLEQTAEHTRAYLKIQDGCNQFCSYCMIPYARGRVRSKKETDVILEVEGLVERGYREIVLTGIHLSSYGLDFLRRNGGDYLQGDKNNREILYQKEILLDLLERLERIPGLERIRLGSLEPRIITEHFVQRLSAMEKICPHFHLSLQSGCDAVLKRMNRQYTTDEYYEKVMLLRKYFDHPAITTDIIVGFPKETEEEFSKTVDFIRKVRFYEMHIFKYSRRKGTAADQMEGQVKESVKARRSELLLEIGKAQSEDYRKDLLGSKITVLLEEQKLIDGKTYMVGYTSRYVQAAYETKENLSNCMITGYADAFLTKDTLLMSLEPIFIKK